MGKACYFCGSKLRFYNTWTPDGYDLCQGCATKWEEHDRVALLLEDGMPHTVFQIDGCTADDGANKYKGSLIFFDKAVAFLAEQKQVKPVSGLTSVAGWFGGALGALVVGTIQDKLAKRHVEQAPPIESLRDALQNATGLFVIKRQDVRSIVHSWREGFVIETACRKFDWIQMPKELFTQNQERIQAYVEGRDEAH